MNLYQRFPMKDNRFDFTLGVAYPHDAESLLTIKEALQRGIISKAILCGDQAIIKQKMDEIKLAAKNIEVIHCPTMEEAADRVAQLVSENKAQAAMKCLIDTSIFLKPMLKKEYQIKQDRLLSHLMLAYRESDNKLFLVSDGGMIIAPTIEQKKEIIINAVEFAHTLGMNDPVVVPLTAKEKPYDKMPATLDAQRLHEMNLSGEITGCRVSGPLQFDVAISLSSATKKEVHDPLAGHADILIVPAIESGNILVKALTYLADFVGYGLILGAKVPMIVVSRSDGEEEKLGSLYLARLMMEAKKHHV